MSKFIAASRQATKMDQNRIRLEAKISEVQADCRGKTKVVDKATEVVRELKNLIEELKAEVIEKDTHLDHLQREKTNCAPFLKRPKKMLLRSSKLSISLPSFWIGTMLLALKSFVWMLRNASLKLTSTPSSSILVLQALSFRRAL